MVWILCLARLAYCGHIYVIKEDLTQFDHRGIIRAVASKVAKSDASQWQEIGRKGWWPRVPVSIKIWKKRLTNLLTKLRGEVKAGKLRVGLSAGDFSKALQQELKNSNKALFQDITPDDAAVYPIHYCTSCEPADERQSAQQVFMASSHESTAEWSSQGLCVNKCEDCFSSLLTKKCSQCYYLMKDDKGGAEKKIPCKKSALNFNRNSEGIELAEGGCTSPISADLSMLIPFKKSTAVECPADADQPANEEKAQTVKCFDWPEEQQKTINALGTRYRELKAQSVTAAKTVIPQILFLGNLPPENGSAEANSFAKSIEGWADGWAKFFSPIVGGSLTPTYQTDKEVQAEVAAKQQERVRRASERKNAAELKAWADEQKVYHVPGLETFLRNSEGRARASKELKEHFKNLGHGTGKMPAALAQEQDLCSSLSLEAMMQAKIIFAAGQGTLTAEDLENGASEDLENGASSCKSPLHCLLRRVKQDPQPFPLVFFIGKFDARKGASLSEVEVKGEEEDEAVVDFNHTSAGGFVEVREEKAKAAEGHEEATVPTARETRRIVRDSVAWNELLGTA